MPTIGGVFVPDNLMPRYDPSTAPRPGLGSILGAATEQAYGQLRYGLPYQFAKLSGNITPQDEQFYKEGLGWAQRAGDSAAPASVSDLTSGRVGIGRFALENLTASAPQLASTIAATIGGAAIGTAVAPGPGTIAGGIGGLVGGIGINIPQFSASNVARAVQEEGGLSQEAAERSLFASPLQAASDVLVERYLPGAGHVLGDVAAHQAGNFLTRTVKSIAKAGATEAVSEAGQQLGERYAAGLPVTGTDAAAEYVNAAVTAFAVGGMLGAGGGFRRAPAVAKSPADVTTDDINGFVTDKIAGYLPAPTDVNIDSGGTARVNPAGQNTLALPSPDQFPRPADVVTDARGLSAVNPDAQSALLAEPSPGTPIPPPPPPALPAPTGEGSVLPAEPNNVLVDSRGLSATGPDAQIALLSTPGAGAPVAPPAPDFQTQLADTKKGLRGGWVQKLDATDQQDLLNKTYTEVFENQNTASNVARFAQRVGLLDDKLEPTALATELGQQRDAAAQARASNATAISLDTGTPDAAFGTQWDQLKRDAGIKRNTKTVSALGTPGNLEQAQGSVMHALGTDTSSAETSQVEKLAQKMGLITDDDARDITPLGRRAFLSTPEGFEASIAAARDQGYDGAQASIFDRGIKAQLSGEAQGSFTNFEDLAAYEAGKVWAQGFVDKGETTTLAQMRAIMSRQDARQTGVAVPQEAASRRELNAQQTQQQALNQLLDRVDMTGVSQGDVAGLFRMVRDGASPTEVGQAIQQVQGGQPLFAQPGAATHEIASPQRIPGQPRFVEANPALQPREQAPQGGRAVQRSETSAAVETKRAALRQEIDAAYASQDISTRERIGLLSRLVNNDFLGVVNGLPGGPLRNEMNVSRRDDLADVAARVGTGPTAPLARTAPTAQLRALIRTGNVTATLQHLADHTADAGRKLVARKLLAGGGWDRVTMTAAADQGNLYGDTTLNGDGSSAVNLYGENGQAEEPVLHELLHAYVQQRWSSVAKGQDAAVRGFTDLWNQIGTALQKDHPELVSSEAWASNFANSPDEALSWVMTNKDAQAFLKGIDENGDKVSTDKSLWGKFVDWVRNLVGLPQNARVTSALDQLLQAGHAVLDAGRDATIDATQNADEQARMEMRVRTADGANDAFKSVVDAVGGATDKLNLADWGVKARRVALGWLSHNQLDRQFGDRVPGLVQHSEAHRSRAAVRGRFETMGDEAYQGFERLPDNIQKWVGQLMATATEHQIDPDKAFDDHEHLKGVKNIDALRRLHGELVDLKNKLSRGDGEGIKVYQQMRALNEAQNYARMATGLHAMVATDPEYALGVAGAGTNPMDRFMLQPGLVAPGDVRAHWQQALNDQVGAVQAFIDQKEGEAATMPPGEQRATVQHISPIKAMLASVHQAQAGMARAPYFHLGRFGDNFGSAVIRTNEDGTVDPKAQRHVADELAKAGFGQAQISADNTKPRIALRFDTVDQARAFRDLALNLQRQGWLSDDKVKWGPRTQEDNFGTADGLPSFVQRYIQDIEASPQFAADDTMSAAERGALDKQKRDMVQLALDTWLESQPDSSISKVLAPRDTVAGYDKNMIRNFAHRWNVGSISLANVATQAKFNEAYTNMRSQVNEAREAASGQDPYVAADLVREVKRRDATAPIRPATDAFDKLRAIGHGYFLGMSPAYALVNLTQLGVTALPELAKANGYNNSFHAMRRAAVTAGKIMNAARSEAWALGPKHAADLVLTDNVLQRSGLSERDANFMRHMIATGTIDIGTSARALGQVAKGAGDSKLDVALKYASAFGLYSETFTRLVAALAAHELHGGSVEEAAKYATNVVSNSMFDYQSWNTARQLGKQGFAGPITPLLTQFMSYSTQLTEKLYSETMDAIGRQRPGETAEDAAQRRAEARTFLGGHLTAVTALAGTLGLPFASVFAAVLEKAFGSKDEPWDATAAWRDFLAGIFGKGAAEVIARGAPRALGFDLSTRAGEQDLLPFSQMIGDRRSWRESIQSTFGRSIGASPDMLLNVADAGEKFSQGDVLSGLKSFLPIALKGPVEAYRMTDQGYVDSRGTKLPMSPGAAAIMWQLLGFTPAEKAEYSEARGDQMSRRVSLEARASELRQGIVKALIRGDHAQAGSLIKDAQTFDKANPAFAVVPSLAGSVQRQATERARAAALNAPLGVSVKDITGRALTGYANVDYRAGAR